MNWLKLWSKVTPFEPHDPEPVDLAPALRAREQARQQLEHAREQRPLVRNMADTLTARIVENHFAPRIAAAYAAPRRERP